MRPRGVFSNPDRNDTRYVFPALTNQAARSYRTIDPGTPWIIGMAFRPARVWEVPPAFEDRWACAIRSDYLETPHRRYPGRRLPGRSGGPGDRDADRRQTLLARHLRPRRRPGRFPGIP